MKILQIGKYYWPKGGGIEKHVKILSGGLRENGIDIEVVASNTKNDKEVNFVNGVKVTRLPKLFELFNQPIVLGLLKFLRQANTDIIHVHLPNPLATISVLLSRKVRIVVTYHSDIIGKPLAFVADFFTKLLLEKALAIIVQSPNYISGSKILRKCKRKIVVIPSCVDFDNYGLTKKVKNDVKNLRKTLGLNGKTILLFVGRLIPYKGVDYLLNAMTTVSKQFEGKVKLLIVGDGKLKSRLIDLASKLHLKKDVKFLGYVNEEKLIAYYHLADIFILPSITRQEAFGLVQVEAMACGKPVISTNIKGSGVPWVNLHNKTGLVVPVKDSDSLAEAIITLMKNRSLRKRFGKNAMRRVKLLFDKERMVNETAKLYNKILAS